MDCENVEERTIEILRNRLYFSAVKVYFYKKLRSSRTILYITFDEEFKYKNFFNDFGPLNVSYIYKYCCRISKCLQDCKAKRRIVHFTSLNIEKKTNAALLMGAFAIICLRMDPYQVYHKILAPLEPFRPFVDALQHTSLSTINIYDCIHALTKAIIFNLVNFDDFNVLEYDLYDRVPYGNMNWIVPRKFLAFLGPSETGIGFAHKPEFYVEYFLQNDIKTIIRLNNKLYDSAIFTDVGIQHFELFFDDGGVPSQEIVMKFFRIVETAPAAIAVHCKAGLGRTGTLIGLYLMKHYQMSAREAVGWLRLCRPGSVIGPQQAWLEEMENVFWQMGNEYRMRHYGEEEKIPQHKYGIYSKQWSLEKRKLLYLENARRQVNDFGPLIQRPLMATETRNYFRHISKMISTVKSFEQEKNKRVMQRCLTAVPKTRFGY